MPLDIHKQGRMVSRTLDGIYLGVSLTTGESIVGNAEGVFKTRTVHRRPIDQRWSAEHVLALRGTPWKPYQFNDSDKLAREHACRW